MNTATIIALLGGITTLASTVIDSQTADQKKIIWDRYIEVTAPLHQLIVKLENLVIPADQQAVK